MNAVLQTTTIPFGHAVASLGLRRVNQILAPSAPERDILEIEARVFSAAGHPLALVRERFTPALLHLGA